MSISPELIRQEVACLHRFIEPIIRMCSDLRDDYPVYSSPSREFFVYIQNLGNETLRFLEAFPENVLRDSRTTSSKRQKLQSLKAAWEHLHQYVRPALDADSLHLPTPLITALHDSLHEFNNWREYRFTLFHTAEANYFEIPAEMARETANRIAALIGGTKFPQSLGLLGIPYSQGDGCFLNCILAHEIGHFIYQEDVSHTIQAEIDTALDRLVDEIADLDDEDLSFCTEVLRSWTEEVFCDLFAIFLIGPAFSFAFSQLVGASFLIEQPDGQPADFFSFIQTHPSEFSRLQKHQELLNRLGWWEVIKNWKSAFIEVLHRCASGSSLYAVEVVLPVNITQSRFLQCYEEICDYLVKYFADMTSNLVPSVQDFEREAAVISKYLRRAIIPSTIVIEGGYKYPTAVVLLNAGFRFFLEDFTLLLNNIRGENADSIETRSRLMRRLELWLLKALEDSRLLLNQVD